MTEHTEREDAFMEACEQKVKELVLMGLSRDEAIEHFIESELDRDLLPKPLDVFEREIRRLI